MQIFIEATDLNIWKAIELGPHIPTIVDVSTSTTTQKPRDKWTKEDRRKIQYDLKAKNIITSTLGIDEYFRVSNCTNAKDMWDTLQLTHEGTTNVKRSLLSEIAVTLGCHSLLKHLKTLLIKSSLGKIFAKEAR